MTYKNLDYLCMCESMCVCVCDWVSIWVGQRKVRKEWFLPEPCIMTSAHRWSNTSPRVIGHTKATQLTTPGHGLSTHPNYNTPKGVAPPAGPSPLVPAETHLPSPNPLHLRTTAGALVGSKQCPTISKKKIYNNLLKDIFIIPETFELKQDSSYRKH